MLKHLKRLSVTLQQHLDTWIGVERVERSLSAVSQHFAHNVVGCYNHEALCMGIVEYIIRRVCGRVGICLLCFRIIVTGQCYVSFGDIGCPLRGDVLAVSLWLYGYK